MPRIIIGATGAAVVVGSALVALLLQPYGAESTPVRVTLPVERRNLEETVVTRGVVDYAQTGTITAGAAGRVTEIAATPGATVVSNEVLLFIDGRPAVAVAGDQPFYRELALGSDGPDVSELQRLLKASGHDPGPDNGDFNEETQAALMAWQAEHGFFAADGQLRLNDMMIGPWPARVGRLIVTVGEFVAPGQQLVTLTADSPTVQVDLLPSDRLRVHEGDPSRIAVPGTASEVNGTILFIAPSATTGETGSGTPGEESLTYLAVIGVDDPLDVPPGTQVQVTITTAEASEALAVPIAAIVSDASGNPAVRILAADGGVELVAVQTGISEGAYVEITSGLEGDETVILDDGSG